MFKNSLLFYIAKPLRAKSNDRVGHIIEPSQLLLRGSKHYLSHCIKIHLLKWYSSFAISSEEFKKLNAVFKGSMHTIGYIVDALKRQNYTNSYCEIYGDLYFECWREELDTSDKYNPYMKKVTYKERVTPISELPPP